jgi:fatty-acyl-CoA synthase
MAATFVGGAIIPHLQFDPDATLDAIERHRAHDLVCVPLMTWKVIDAQRARPRDLSSLVAVFSSGGMAPPEIWSAIRETLGAPELTTAYGMSETTASTTCTLPEGPDVMLSTTNGRLKDAGVAGDRALGGKLAIYKARDPQTGAELPPGAEGELMARGPIITKGYYNKPEETAATFTEDGWLCTGDVGTIDADGNLRLTGRIKETYRCAGETVMPREIEIVIETHPAVAEAHVVGVPHGRVGEVGCACIVPVDPLAPPTPEDVIVLCTRELARFKVPRHVLIVRQEDLPRTATGRVQKFKLVEHVKPLLNPDQPTAVPVA